MKILVTGVSSLAGHKVALKAAEMGFEVVGVYNRNRVDFGDLPIKLLSVDLSNPVAAQSLVFREAPDLVFHAAAYGDVDGCERDKQYAWMVNVEATRNIARACEVLGIPLVYLSTDYVFDGERGNYSEDDPPCPTSYYGLTKLLAEELARSICSRCVVVRTSSLYGVGPGRKNFAVFVLEKLSRGESVRALVDQYTSPTLDLLLAEAVLELVERRYLGLIHVAGERMSRYEFALKVAEALNLPREKISTARMEEFSWLAKRPTDSSLDTSKARRLLKTRFYDTELAMQLLRREYLKARGFRD